MFKKIINHILISVLVVTTLIPSQVMANSQSQVESFSVDEVYFVLGQHQITGLPILSPTITLSWEDPDSWLDDPTEDTHDPDFYDITVNNLTFNETTTVRVDYDEKSLELHEETNLETGSYYEFTIEPKHYHTETVDGETISTLAPSVGTPLKAYAITDVNVELEPSENEIQVIWDDVDLDGLDYRIVYAVGDYSNQSKEDLIDNQEGQIIVQSDSTGVESFYDSVAGRDRLSYTISDQIYPGQIYSVIVEPMLDYKDGYAIQRNRNYPNVFTCSTNVELTVTEDGDYVRLEWDIPASFEVGQDQEEYELVEAQIIEYISGQGRTVVIFDNTAATMEYYKVSKPSTEAEYQIILSYEAVGDSAREPITAESEKVPYVPAELKITPTQPQVPSPISEEILEELSNKYTSDELKDVLEEEYLLPDDVYSGNLYDLLNSGKTFQVLEDSNVIQLVFTPFIRKDVDDTSSTYGEDIVDTNVYYDIYVTNDLNSLSGAIKIEDHLSFDEDDEAVIRNDDDEIIGYRVELEEYYDSSDSELKTIIPNQLYYIEIIAIKDWGDEEATSEPNIVPIFFDYDGNIYSPPVISKPPLKIRSEDNTETSVTVQWQEEWWEIISPDAGLDEWATEIWVDEDGTISTESIEEGTYYAIYESETEIERLEEATGIEFITRYIDLGKDPFGLSDVYYQFYKMPYSEVKDVLDTKQETDSDYSLNEYILELMNEDIEGLEPIDWEDITPTVDEDDSDILLYTETGLTPNTEYVFLIYPHRIDLTGELLYAHYPGAIVVVTDPETTDVSPDPTVPTLYVSSYTDISATLTWKYNTDFTYELVYATEEDVTSAQEVEIILSDDPEDSNYPTDGTYFEQVVNDLFPDTQYYFWIRAIQSDSGNTSDWSNPVLVTTSDIEAPDPPRGIGLASLESLAPYGYEENRSTDYLTLEWLLDYEDDPEAYEDADIKKSFVYIIEMADNPNFIDPLYIETSDGDYDILPENVEKLEKNLIKINDLIGNRKYYFRLKTKVILEGTEDDQEITKESTDYSSVVGLMTLTGSGEYDEGAGSGIIILPTSYFETLYDEDEKMLTYRFRYDEEDEEGNFDQFFSEQLINQLMQEDAYEYMVEIIDYEDEEVTSRRLEIPYRLWAGFKEYSIDLVIETDKTTMHLSSNSLDSALNTIVYQNGENPDIFVTIKDTTVSNIKIGDEQIQYPVIVPQWVNVQLVTTKGTQTLEGVDSPITLSFDVISRAQVYNQPIGVARWDEDDSQWELLEGTYNNYVGEVETQTQKLGRFYSYAIKNNHESEEDHWAEDYKNRVFSQVNLLGYSESYDDSVKKEVFLNLMKGLIEGDTTIDLTEGLTDTTLNHLMKADYLISSEGISDAIERQEALYMMVKIIENKQGYRLDASNQSISIINENSEISNSYRREMAIALDYGLISDSTQIRPQEELTYGELFVLLDTVLSFQ